MDVGVGSISSFLELFFHVLLLNWFPWSVTILFGFPTWGMKFSNILAIVVWVVCLLSAYSLTYLLNPSNATSTNQNQNFELGKGPQKSINTDTRGSAVNIGCERAKILWVVVLFLWQVSQELIVFLITLYKLEKWKSWLIISWHFRATMYPYTIWHPSIKSFDNPVGRQIFHWMLHFLNRHSSQYK